MIETRKIDENTVQEWVLSKTIKLSILLDKKKELEEELENRKEPTEKELIEEGRMTHPYYMDTERLNDELISLNKKIEDFQNISKETERRV